MQNIKRKENTVAFIGILLIDIILIIVFGSACVGLLLLIIGTIMRIAGKRKGNAGMHGTGRMLQLISLIFFVPLALLALFIGMLSVVQA